MLGAPLYAGATKDALLGVGYKQKNITDAEKAAVLPYVRCERILHYSTLPRTHVFKTKNICRGCGDPWCNACRKRLKAVPKLWVLKMGIKDRNLRVLWRIFRSRCSYEPYKVPPVKGCKVCRKVSNLRYTGHPFLLRFSHRHKDVRQRFVASARPWSTSPSRSAPSSTLPPPPPPPTSQINLWRARQAGQVACSP